jgi:hypothetical protein
MFVFLCVYCIGMLFDYLLENVFVSLERYRMCFGQLSVSITNYLNYQFTYRYVMYRYLFS